MRRKFDWAGVAVVDVQGSAAENEVHPSGREHHTAGRSVSGSPRREQSDNGFEGWG